MVQYVSYLPLTDLISKISNLETVPFVWNVMRSEEYMSKIKATEDAKKFDLIHMIHVIAHHFDLMDCGQIYCITALYLICFDQNVYRIVMQFVIR